MILGVLEKSTSNILKHASLDCGMGTGVLKSGEWTVLADDGVGFCTTTDCDAGEFKGLKPQSIDNAKYIGVFSGEIYNGKDLHRIYDLGRIPSLSEDLTLLVLNLYKNYGLDFLKDLNGKFAFGIWDRAQRKLILARDHLGIEPLYYYIDDSKVVFASRIPLIFQVNGVMKVLNLKGLGKYLLFNYNPGVETMFQNVFKLRPGHLLVVGEKEIQRHRYWKLSFSDPAISKEEEITEKLYHLIKKSVAIRASVCSEPAVFLSGGMDSSTVLAIVKEVNDNPLKTFSYRCQSETFDESRYARLMAEHTGSDHHEIEYTPQNVLLMPQITKEMNEPFCDVGINVATYILGKEANHRVSDVFTGDGGDELFGGHPVYEADKVSQYVEKIPSVFRSPFFSFLSRLPDSDKKKNITVKLKRFSENVALPPTLFSHRWRTYYNGEGLKGLLTDHLTDCLKIDDLYGDILQFNLEADGPDILSRSLYSDYQTVVDFYFRRNDLNRVFQFRTHFPLLDYRLVEYCATIPSALKISGWFDTKYILKKAMEQILPHPIVYRKDKLGHSIPLKNWIRDNREVKDFILDYISEETVRKRGFFQGADIYKMIREHMEKKRNNSHRLWSLAVLEMWLQEHYDR